MSTILILNIGSTSFKYEFFNTKNLDSLHKGEFKILEHKKDDLEENIKHLFRNMVREIGNLDELVAIGHRVVHGGEKFKATRQITAQEIFELEQSNGLAPLHNPYNLAGIKAALEYFPAVANYAVFDTAFFSALPTAAKTYPIPYQYYEEFGIKKYGFHGISHRYALEETARLIKKPITEINVITVHLGGGCSVTAVRQGQPIDTSMGYTPLEGLMMQTRSGDLDPGVIMQILTNLSVTHTTTPSLLEKLNQILNFESGLKGIAGKSDYLELLQAMEWGEEKAVLAFEMFTNRIKKYIGAYLFLLDRVDAITFTGKIGAGNPVTRKKICAKMNLLKNIPILSVETHEELAIAREVKTVLNF